jgi:hypothetical protein
METDVLTPTARALFPLLSRFRDDFYLAGGTALALQIAHRESIDFDLFSDEPITRKLLTDAESEFAGKPLEVLENTSEELTITISGVKVTFLHYPFPPLLPLVDIEPLPLLSTKEILASKAYTIGRRGEFKDYVDIYAGLRGNHSSLPEIIGLAHKKYGDAFNGRLFLEQLVHLDEIPEYPIEFIGGTVERVEVDRFLRDAVSSFKSTM